MLREGVSFSADKGILNRVQDDSEEAACAASLRSDCFGSDSTNDKQLSLASRVSHSGCDPESSFALPAVFRFSVCEKIFFFVTLISQLGVIIDCVSIWPPGRKEGDMRAKQYLTMAIIGVMVGWIGGCDGGKRGNADQPPKADAGVDRTLNRMDTVTLDGTQSSDPEGGKLSYSWRIVSHPDGSGALIGNRTKAKASITPDRPGSYTIALRVRDEHNNTDEDNVTLTVRDTLILPFADTQHGLEPWITNGYADGTTRMLKNIYTRPADLWMVQKVIDAGGGHFYFFGSDQVAHQGLWSSDGTPEGTRLVKALPNVNNIVNFAFISGKLFFNYKDTAHGDELWISDGSEAGTHLLKDICPNTGGVFGSYPREMTVVGNKLFFVADDGTNGRELWVSDGTENGTAMVWDIRNGPDGSFPEHLTGMGASTLYFSANDGTNGRELWATDGTSAGTYLVDDIRSGPGSSSPSDFAVDEGSGKLYFAADNGTHGKELWVSQGLPGNTKMVANIRTDPDGSSPSQLHWINHQLIFVADDGTHGKELWVSDGTVGGTTQILKNIASGSDSSYPANITPVSGGTFYFTANDGSHGKELWISNSTAAGTHLVKDICPGVWDSWLDELTVMQGKLYFAADDGINGIELWVSDATPQGTRMVRDLEPGSEGSVPKGLQVVGGSDLYFRHETMNAWFTGYLTHSDGTADGTSRMSYRGAPEGGSLYPAWSPPQTRRLPDGALFVADDGVHGFEPWFSDGTSAGTGLLGDVAGGAGSSYPDTGAVLDGVLYFSAHSDTYGWELWRSDGTPGGTRMVKDIYSGHESAFPDNFVSGGGRLFFAASDAAHGRELWISDGTATGTKMVKDIRTGPDDSWPDDLVGAGGRVFFAAYDGSHGKELWISDGTATGTKIVKDIRTGPNGSWPDDLVAVGGRVFFAANDGTHGEELWISDGTKNGTKMVKDIQTGSGNSSPDDLVVAGGRVFFAADDGLNGEELWISDGTKNGTKMVKDICAGADDSLPDNLAEAGGKVLFVTQNGSDREWWVSDGSSAGTHKLRTFAGASYTLPAGKVNGRVVIYVRKETTMELWSSDGTAAGTVKLAGVPINRLDL